MKGEVDETTDYDTVVQQSLLRSQSGKRILGLDLGTNCGYAYCDMGEREPLVIMGQIDLSLATYDSGAVRPAKLRALLHTLSPCAIFFEDVKYTPMMPPGARFNAAAILARSSTSQEMFGVLKYVVQDYAEQAGIVATSFPIGSIKKFATGLGNASKEKMIAACNKKFGVDLDADGYASTGHDNIADAAFVLAIGLSQYAKGLDLHGKGKTEDDKPARRTQRRLPPPTG